MARRNADTETTMRDVVRQLRTISTKLDKLDAIEHTLKDLRASALTRDPQLDARVSKLEVDVARLKRRT